MASSGSDSARAYEVVYTEAIRALDLQRAAFDALRARVGFLLSAATIATSFLGGLALQVSGDAGSWIAIGLFVAFGAVALRLLWPRAEGADGFSSMNPAMPKPQPNGTVNPMRPYPGDEKRPN